MCIRDSNRPRSLARIGDFLTVVVCTPVYGAVCCSPLGRFFPCSMPPSTVGAVSVSKRSAFETSWKTAPGGGGMIHTVVFGRPQLLVVLDFFSRLLVQRFICTVMVRLLVSRCICTVRDCLLRCANKMFFNFQFRVRHGATTRPSGLNAVRGVSPTLPGDEDISEWLSPPCLILRDQAGSTCSRAR